MKDHYTRICSLDESLLYRAKPWIVFSASNMQDVKHRLGLLWRQVVTTIHRPKIYPQHQRGKLSPQQFVDAGDMLIAKSPVWEWMGSVSSSHQSYLPPDKQFLLFRHGSASYWDKP